MTLTIQLLCSTGAFSRFPDQTGYQAVLEYGPQLDVDGFELMFYPNWYGNVETIGHNLQRSGLAFPAMHTDKNIGTLLGKDDEAERKQGIREFEENCRLGKIIGTRTLVLHLWGWPELDDDLARNLSALSQCLDIAEYYDMQIAIETIPCRQKTPVENVLQAIEYDQRSQVTLDTEFLANHHQLTEVFEAERLWQERRVLHVHVKDSDGQPFSEEGIRKYLHPGEGDIDFAGFFACLKQHDFAGTVSLETPAIEETGEVRIQRLHSSLALLRSFIG
jgi:sugar phosphate isomerase/epimerase